MRRARDHALAPLAAALLLCTGGARAESIWLELTSPEADLVQPGPVPLLEVRGRAGVGTPERRDVMILIDASGSTLISSEADVDHDGTLGQTPRRIVRAVQRGSTGSLRFGAWTSLAPRGSAQPELDRMCSDRGDTILAAEVAAARRLVDALDPAWTRMGIVAFWGEAVLEAPLGSPPDQLGEALDRVAAAGDSWLPGTDFQAAIDRALAAFATAPPERDAQGASAARERHILLLSDGQPTLPGRGREPKKKALEAAQRAREAGAPIHTFALGPEALDHEGIYLELAQRTGGHTIRLEQPAAVMAELAHMDLAHVADISVRNLTSGQEGRALRVFLDGSFDGFVPLVPGDNQLRVTARATSGQETQEERVVRYDPTRARDPADLARFQQALRLRTAETRALRSIRLGAERKHLELAVDTPPVAAVPNPDD